MTTAHAGDGPEVIVAELAQIKQHIAQLTARESMLKSALRDQLDVGEYTYAGWKLTLAPTRTFNQTLAATTVPPALMPAVTKTTVDPKKLEILAPDVYAGCLVEGVARVTMSPAHEK